MSARSLSVLAALLVVACAVPAAIGQGRAAAAKTLFQVAELTASDAQSLSSVGFSVAASGDTVVVGAPGGASSDIGYVAGAVYVYVKPANGWGNMTQVAQLTPSDASNSDGFGAYVAIIGNTIVTDSNFSEIYVFVEPAGGWTNMTETAILKDGSGHCLCGQVAFNGNTIAVGSPIQGEHNIGSIQVFTEPAGGWQNASEPNANLKQVEGQYGDQSFHSVAISGDTIVGEGIVCGQVNCEYHVFLFSKPAAGWKGQLTPAATLSSTQSLNYFTAGQVSIDGDTVVAGSPSPNLTFFPPGFVDVWVEPAGGWTDMTETAQLSDGNTTFADEFGIAAAVSGNTIVVGTPYAIVVKTGDLYRGAAYVFTEPPGGWQTTSTYNERLLSSDWTNNDGFGSSAAVSDGAIIVGEPYGPQEAEVGAAYVFEQ
jgi:FG-GAP repeat